MVDHTYDAIVVGAGGAGLRVGIINFSYDWIYRLHLDVLNKGSRLHAFQNFSQPDPTQWLLREVSTLLSVI